MVCQEQPLDHCTEYTLHRCYKRDSIRA